MCQKLQLKIANNNVRSPGFYLTCFIIALLLIVPLSSRADDDVFESRIVNGHKFELAQVGQGDYRARVDGKEVLSSGPQKAELSLEGVHAEGGKVYVVLSRASESCAARLLAIDLSGAVPLVSKPMGNCSQITQVEVIEGALRVTSQTAVGSPSVDTFLAGQTKTSLASSAAATRQMPSSAPVSPTSDDTVHPDSSTPVTAEVQKIVDASIQSFFGSLYASYDPALVGLSDPFHPPLASLPGITEENPETIYDQETSTLIRRDQATSLEGDRRVLDFDPICDCRDYNSVKIAYNKVQRDGVRAATVTVWIVIDNNQSSAKMLHYTLANLGGVWFIHDIQGERGSLRKLLLDGLDRKPTIATKSLPPSSMKECENGVCGIWAFGVDHGEGEWLNGAVASLWSEVHEDGSIIIRRKEIVARWGRVRSPVLTAVYRAKLVDGKIEQPTAVWTFEGHESTGTWSAELDTTTIRDARHLAEEASAKHNLFGALRWSSAGAVLDDSVAEFKCALAYLNGAGLPKNLIRAAEYLQKANAQGNINARLLLAGFYRTSTGVKGSAPQADYLDKLAGQEGEAIFEKIRAAQARADASDQALLEGIFGVLKSINNGMVARQAYCKTHFEECRQDDIRRQEEEDIRAEQAHDSEVREFNYEQTHRH